MKNKVPIKKYDITQCALYKCRTKRRLEYLLCLDLGGLKTIDSIIGYHKFEIDKNIKLYSLNGEKCENSALRKIYVEKQLIKYVKEEQIDVMIAVDVALYLYLIPLQIKKICKCIAWEHFNYYISPNKLVKYARKLAAEHADCVVVLGKNDLNNYLTQYKHCKNVTYIYNPIAVDTRESTPLTQKRAIAVGRLSRQKGFDMLVEAWALIEKEVPDWKLDIYGQ